MARPVATDDTHPAPRREDRRATSAALWTLAALATVMFMWFARELLIPLVLSLLVAFALSPVVARLERLGLPRAWASALIMAVLLAGLVAGGFALRDEITAAAKQLPAAVQKTRDRIEQAMPELTGALPPSTPASPGGGAPDDAKASSGGASPTGSGMPAGAAGALLKGSAGLAALAGHIVVIYFLVFFLLAGGPSYHARLIEIAGPARAGRRAAEDVIHEITEQIQRFLVVRVITGAVVGVATWLGLLALGVQQAMLWGLLAGIFNSIPYFGPIIVSGGVFAVGAMQQGDFTLGLKAAALALVITSLEGWILEPPLMGRAERMSTLAVFVGLVVWSWIWGVWGTLLAVPMLIIVKAIADHVESLRPISRLLAER